MAKSKKTQLSPSQVPRVLRIPPMRMGLILFGIGFLLYANTFSHGYTQDDAIVISENAFTQKGVSGLAEIFKYDTFRGFFRDAGKATLVAGGRYRPLTLATFALELEAFGNSPLAGHLFNALYYGLTAMLLYFVILQWLKPSHQKTSALFIAFGTAILFVAHPIHTEAVANIKGRDEIFSLMFSLAALLVAFKTLKTGKYKGHFLAGILFFLALLSKENALIFVLAGPLAIWFFSDTHISRILRTVIPWWLAAMVMLIIRFSIIPTGGEPSMELMNNPFLKLEDGRWAAFSFGEWSATIMFTLGKYVQLLFVPHPLIHDYYPRQIPIMEWTDWRVVASFLSCSLLLAYALVRMPKKDPVSFGILFFFISLFPVSNILVTVGTNMSERFLFTPSVGFSLALSAAAWQLVVRKKTSTKDRSRKLYWLTAIFAVIGIAYAVKTVDRNRVWKDNYTLFTTDVQNAPNSAKLRNSAGGELIANAILPENAQRREAMLLEAIGHLEVATTIHPTYKNAFLLLGNANNYLENYEKAVTYYERALQLDPGYPEASNNLFLTLRQAGRYYGEQKNDLGRSLDFLRRALDREPNDYETLRLLGIASGIGGDHSNAINYFARAAEVEPNNAQAWWNLGNAWYHAGNLEKQAAMHLRARELDPGINQKQQQ